MDERLNRGEGDLIKVACVNIHVVNCITYSSIAIFYL